VIWLDRQIREGRYPSVQDLQDEFSVKHRHAFNVVGYLRDSLNAPVCYSRERRGYYYSDPTYVLPAVFLQEGELLALLLAEQVSRHYLGTPLEAPLRAAMKKISRYLPEGEYIELTDLADRFHFAGGTSVEVPLSLLAGVQQAIREHRVLRLLYHSLARDEIRERDVEPHFLTNVTGDWMVVAWDRWRDEDRVFMLARIHEHQVLEERFQPRPELSRDRYSRYAFRTEHGAEPYDVALRFDPFQARWVRERTWHPSQRVEELTDGGLILRLTISGEGDLLRWVLGYGSHVEVLEPQHLRERVAEEAQ
jgi:predicted DNA-binding transcriptional regulator YafY